MGTKVEFIERNDGSELAEELSFFYNDYNVIDVKYHVRSEDDGRGGTYNYYSALIAYE